MTNKKFTIFVTCLLIGFMVASLFHFTISRYNRNRYPYSTFLFDPGNRFGDFINMYPVVKTRSPYHHDKPLLLSVYAPMGNFIYNLFSLVSVDTGLIMFLLASILMQVAICKFGLAGIADIATTTSKLSEFLIFSFLSYPFLFNLDRANLEIYVFASVFFFVYFQRQQKVLLSSLFLGLGIALKLYPVIMIVLCLERKKPWRSLKQLGLVAGFGIIFSLLGLLPFTGGVEFNISWMFRNMNAITTHAANNLWAISHSTSLYSTLRLLSAKLGWFNWNFSYQEYVYVALIVSFIICLLVLLSKIEYWKKLFLLIVICLTVPAISFDYKMLHLYVPLFFFLRERDSKPWDWFYFCGFVILFIPKAYYYLIDDISIAVPLNCLLLLLMSAIIIATDGIPSLATRFNALMRLAGRAFRKYSDGRSP